MRACSAPTAALSYSAPAWRPCVPAVWSSASRPPAPWTSVDLVVEEGEVCGLLGPNGAGKTTLLRMLFGLVRAGRGRGRALRTPAGDDLGDDARGRRGLRRGSELLSLPLGARRTSSCSRSSTAGTRARGSRRRSRRSACVRGAGIASTATRPGCASASGSRRALMRTPRLLLLDEPMGGLDPAGVREVGALMRALSAEGVAVLLSSHQIGEIEDVCDSFTVPPARRVVWDGTRRRAARAGAGIRVPPRHQRGPQRRSDRRRASWRVRAVGARGCALRSPCTEGILDPYVLALAGGGIAVRRLELLMSPLEAMFFALTDGETAAAPATTSTVPVRQMPARAAALTAGRSQPLRTGRARPAAHRGVPRRVPQALLAARGRGSSRSSA